MIKKIFLPLIVLLICFLIVINYLAYKSPTKTKLITQQKAYSITSENNLNILLYANKKNAYTDKDAYDKVYLKNLNETKKIELKVISIKKLLKYNYLKEDYTEYELNFSLPQLNSYYYIEEAYLYVRLKNGSQLELSVGSFDYYNEEEVLNITELFGRRYDDFPTLESVTMRFSLTEDVFVEHIYLTNSLFTYVGKWVKDGEQLTINFNKLDKITNELTIKITYQKGEEAYSTITPYFNFYITNENPLVYSVLNNVYSLD